MILFSEAAENTRENQTVFLPPTSAKRNYPTIILYTISTCPHCRDAKEYLTLHKIPFTNREVDTDDLHMAELIKIYVSMGVPENKRGVPLIIINDSTRLQGFNKEKLDRLLLLPPSH
jgi:glutaredoxin